MPYSIGQIRERMMTCWQTIQTLEASATMTWSQKTSNDIHLLTESYHAWWQSPNCWRHDRTVYDGTQLRYQTVGDQWSLEKNGKVVRSGSVTDARQSKPTHKNLLYYGRPYLSPRANAELWGWLNAPVWAASCSFVANNGYGPIPDETYHDKGIVHVLAGTAWVHDHDLVNIDGAMRHKWSLHHWDLEMELTDYVNFFNYGWICGRDFAEE